MSFILQKLRIIIVTVIKKMGVSCCMRAVPQQIRTVLLLVLIQREQDPSTL